MKVLIAGATGMVGGEAARILSSGGDAVRALVRSTSNAEKMAALKSAGIEVVEGDLRDRASLDAACDGVDAVISTVSAAAEWPKRSRNIRAANLFVQR